ncbi:MAG: CDGSH iron-sulfur domain-containing protein [Bacteroidales bacterium]|nr:CDGSH iron-sulfur domain-containing protein [Bacteroidales bacterium]
MDKGTTDKIIDIVDQCPTDALTYTRINSPEKEKEKPSDSINEKKESIEPPTKIQIIENGPALVSGEFEIKDINGTKLAKANNIALCRCGKSSTLPFCDGTHNRIGFKENR